MLNKEVESCLEWCHYRLHGRRPHHLAPQIKRSGNPLVTAVMRAILVVVVVGVVEQHPTDYYLGRRGSWRTQTMVTAEETFCSSHHRTAPCRYRAVSSFSKNGQPTSKEKKSTMSGGGTAASSGADSMTSSETAVGARKSIPSAIRKWWKKDQQVNHFAEININKKKYLEQDRERQQEQQGAGEETETEDTIEDTTEETKARESSSSSPSSGRVIHNPTAGFDAAKSESKHSKDPDLQASHHHRDESKHRSREAMEGTPPGSSRLSSSREGRKSSPRRSTGRSSVPKSSGATTKKNKNGTGVAFESPPSRQKTKAAPLPRRGKATRRKSRASGAEGGGRPSPRRSSQKVVGSVAENKARAGPRRPNLTSSPWSSTRDLVRTAVAEAGHRAWKSSRDLSVYREEKEEEEEEENEIDYSSPTPSPASPPAINHQCSIARSMELFPPPPLSEDIKEVDRNSGGGNRGPLLLKHAEDRWGSSHDKSQGGGDVPPSPVPRRNRLPGNNRENADGLAGDPKPSVASLDKVLNYEIGLNQSSLHSLSTTQTPPISNVSGTNTMKYSSQKQDRDHSERSGSSRLQTPPRPDTQKRSLSRNVVVVRRAAEIDKTSSHSVVTPAWSYSPVSRSYHSNSSTISDSSEGSTDELDKDRQQCQVPSVARTVSSRYKQVGITKEQLDELRKLGLDITETA